MKERYVWWINPSKIWIISCVLIIVGKGLQLPAAAWMF